MKRLRSALLSPPRTAIVAATLACAGCHAVYPYGASEAPRDVRGDSLARDLPGAKLDLRPAADGREDLPPPVDGAPDLPPPLDASSDALPPDRSPVADLSPPGDEGVPDAPPLPDQGVADLQPAADRALSSDAGCADECATIDEQRCDLTTGTTLQSCGQYDADRCLEWGPSIPCPAGQICNLVTDPDVCLPACYPSCECKPYDTQGCAVGECSGIETCTTAGTWGSCAITGAPGVEICDGKDNNCNNVIDDNPTDTPPSCLQADLCYTRTAQCIGGAWTCVDTSVCAEDEACLTGVCCCKGRECGSDPACGVYDAINVCGTCATAQACSGGTCVDIN